MKASAFLSCGYCGQQLAKVSTIGTMKYVYDGCETCGSFKLELSLRRVA